ncbi:hypothetical protein [Algoriphagus chordae]|uniref:Uncharacterized protein n=1 Tax=Algoriphagus chordae TaxID=237019 RepID=A0A2W7SRN2_9BACT|nr:hypothetical protein [Algoriphagus chordae]PZX53282.1 hypothetical protein LV85_01700 [Algoriphagus chordae]
MKTAIFTWLFLLPIQIYASNISTLENTASPTALEESKVQALESDAKVLTSTDLTVRSENFQAIAVSQEKDIQRLKSQLAHKNHEINSQQLDTWKAKSATLIFFVGMLLFAFLYIRTKLNVERPEMATLSKLYPQEK